MRKKIWLLIVPLLLLAGSGGYLIGHKRPSGQTTKTAVEKDPYLAFLEEIYDKVKENYWDKISDEQLANLYKLAAEKLTGKPLVLKGVKKEDVVSLNQEIIGQIAAPEKKKEYAATLADLVLANLQPFGRSRLYSRKEETDLKNTVNNVNPNTDYYAVLGVKKEADPTDVKKAFEEKSQAWDPQKNTSPEAKQKYEEVNRAFQILGDTDSRQLYDSFGAEPTVKGRLISPEIYHLAITKFSPTTFDEMQRLTTKVDRQDELHTLILDLRDNVGGAIDGLPYFLGPFIGQNQFAYQFLHQGETTDYKTKTGWLPSLVRYKRVIVLINNGTQSSAEVMAATLKKYNVGLLVGLPTKGWGTVEKVFTLDHQIDPQEKYSMFLVHSLTLRDDGQPIEGKGVEPVINMKSPDWEKEFGLYYDSADLISAVKEIWAQN